MTTTNLETIRETILDTLITNLTDPENRGTTSWITGMAFEDYENSADFPGWPLITVSHPVTEAHQKAFGTGVNARRMRPVAVELMVHARGGIEIQQLLDAIETVIYTQESSLNSSGLNQVDVVVGTGDLFEVNENVHRIPVTIDLIA